MKILERSLEIAKAAYPDSLEGRCKYTHYSFLWNKSKLLLFATNTNKTHRRNGYNCNYDLGVKKTCSELNLFLKAKNTLDNPNWPKLILVNVMIDKEKKIRNSALCFACQHLMFNFLEMNPKNVYFTDKEGKFKNLKS